MYLYIYRLFQRNHVLRNLRYVKSVPKVLKYNMPSRLMMKHLSRSETVWHICHSGHRLCSIIMNKYYLNYICNEGNLTLLLDLQASGKDLISEGNSF